jgi:MFS family permease
MRESGVAIGLFGVFFAITMLARFIFSRYTQSIYKNLGSKNTIYFGLSAIVLGTLAVLGVFGTDNMLLVYALCAFIAMIPATQKLIVLVFTTYIHHRIKSDERATIMSIKQMYSTFISGIMMMLMKPLIDGFGIQWTMWITLAAMLLILYPLKKVLAIKNIDYVK